MLYKFYYYYYYDVAVQVIQWSFANLPGVSKTLTKKDFPLVSGKTRETGTLFILNPRCKENIQQNFTHKRKYCKGKSVHVCYQFGTT